MHKMSSCRRTVLLSLITGIIGAPIGAPIGALIAGVIAGVIGGVIVVGICGSGNCSAPNKKPFETREELRSAVADYISNGGASDRTREYGYTMNDWDVFKIADFSTSVIGMSAKQVT
jgi:hypothetical protein